MHRGSKPLHGVGRALIIFKATIIVELQVEIKGMISERIRKRRPWFSYTAISHRYTCGKPNAERFSISVSNRTMASSNQSDNDQDDGDIAALLAAEA